MLNFSLTVWALFVHTFSSSRAWTSMALGLEPAATPSVESVVINFWLLVLFSLESYTSPFFLSLIFAGSSEVI